MVLVHHARGPHPCTSFKKMPVRPKDRCTGLWAVAEDERFDATPGPRGKSQTRKGLGVAGRASLLQGYVDCHFKYFQSVFLVFGKSETANVRLPIAITHDGKGVTDNMLRMAERSKCFLGFFRPEQLRWPDLADRVWDVRWCWGRLRFVLRCPKGQRVALFCRCVQEFNQYGRILLNSY